MVTKDTAIFMLLKYFTDVTPVVSENISKNKFLIKKDNWEAQVFNECFNFFYMITESLEAKFGTSKHLYQIFAMANITATKIPKS